MGTISMVWIVQTLGIQNRSSAIVFLLFGSSALVWYVMCLDFLNGALWVRFHGWYFYKSFIDGSNIGSVYRTPLGSRNGQPTIGEELFDIRASVPYGWESMADIAINHSSMCQIFGVSIGPSIGVPKWTILSYLVVVSSYHLSYALILLTGL